jgi:hypothetical protein
MFAFLDLFLYVSLNQQINYLTLAILKLLPHMLLLFQFLPKLYFTLDGPSDLWLFSSHLYCYLFLLLDFVLESTFNSLKLIITQFVTISRLTWQCNVPIVLFDLLQPFWDHIDRRKQLVARFVQHRLRYIICTDLDLSLKKFVADVVLFGSCCFNRPSIITIIRQYIN